ncbi:hypothetical protein [Sulfoacidibacillus thermotolerans]|uniref:PpiC domain-containing protein n=1 Tax=Sulfoacidibacillus thermotolerans TaxID=1765684 RepID=A0A2U3D775_SULT2|nr:hypothetical protein [Sulfoacidibacillus thermotolerans]PWI57140.1 hypothetical protein BM613_10320 [Sulfoacidibacillus thermotolerans]
MKNRLQKLLFYMSLWGFSGLLVGCSAQTNESLHLLPRTSTIAVYQGGVISRSEFIQALDMQVRLMQPHAILTGAMKSQFLKVYISVYKVLLPQIMKSQPAVSNVQIVSLVQQFKREITLYSYHGSEQAFNQSLDHFHISEMDLANWARASLAIEAYQKHLTVAAPSNTELEKFYHSHPAYFTNVTVKQVVGDSVQQVEQMVPELSRGSSSAIFEWTNKPLVSLPLAVQQTLMAAPIGKPSSAIHIGANYVIFDVLQRHMLPYAQVKSQIIQSFIRQRQMQMWEQKIAAVERTAKIRIVGALP